MALIACVPLYDVNDRLPVEIQPVPGGGELGPGTNRKTQNADVEIPRAFDVPGSNVDVLEAIDRHPRVNYRDPPPRPPAACAVPRIGCGFGS